MSGYRYSDYRLRITDYGLLDTDKGNHMRGCLQVVAGFLAFVFVVTAVLALVVVNLLQIVTNRETMKMALDLGPLLTEVGPVLLVEEMRSEAAQQGVVVEDIDTSLLQEAATKVAPPEWVDEQVDAGLDALFNVLETGDPATAVAQINLQPVIQRFQSAEGREAVAVILRSLPACPDPQPTFDLESGDLPIRGCLPKGMDVNQATEIVHTAVVQTIKENPQLLDEAGQVEVNLFQPEQMTPESRQQIEQMSRAFRWGQKGAWLLWLIPWACLILIALFAVRSLSEWGHWWGWPLLFAGGFALLFVVVIPALTQFLFQAMGPPPGTSEVEQMFLTGLRDLFDQVTAVYRRRVLVQSLIILGTGIVFIALGFITNRPEDVLGDWGLEESV